MVAIALMLSVADVYVRARVRLLGDVRQLSSSHPRVHVYKRPLQEGKDLCVVDVVFSTTLLKHVGTITKEKKKKKEKKNGTKRSYKRIHSLSLSQFVTKQVRVCPW